MVPVDEIERRGISRVTARRISTAHNGHLGQYPTRLKLSRYFVASTSGLLHRNATRHVEIQIKTGG